jgi:membrane associated rhomboid family serine protease
MGWGMPSTWVDSDLQMPRLTPVVRTLLITTAAAFVVQSLGDWLTGGAVTIWLGLSWMAWSRGDVWQLVTYLFLHGNLFHLLFNLLALMFMGPETERSLGSRRFAVLYFLSGILGGVGWLLISAWTEGGVCIGASGAIFGVIGAFAALYPQRPVTVFVLLFLVTMRAWQLALSMAAIAALSLLNQQGGIANAAHLAGIVAGVFFALAAARSPSANNPGLRLPWLSRRREQDTVSHEELDRVLERVAQQGIHSLTRSERALLERASRELRRERQRESAGHGVLHAAVFHMKQGLARSLGLRLAAALSVAPSQDRRSKQDVHGEPTRVRRPLRADKLILGRQLPAPLAQFL